MYSIKSFQITDCAFNTDEYGKVNVNKLCCFIVFLEDFRA